MCMFELACANCATHQRCQYSANNKPPTIKVERGICPTGVLVSVLSVGVLILLQYSR